MPSTLYTSPYLKYPPVRASPTLSLPLSISERGREGRERTHGKGERAQRAGGLQMGQQGPPMSRVSRRSWGKFSCIHTRKVRVFIKLYFGSFNFLFVFICLVVRQRPNLKHTTPCPTGTSARPRRCRCRAPQRPSDEN